MQVPVVLDWFNRKLAAEIYPMLGSQFDCDPASIRVIDAFVVRYSADKQRSLPLHCDQSQFSLTVAMNSRDEYVYDTATCLLDTAPHLRPHVCVP